MQGHVPGRDTKQSCHGDTNTSAIHLLTALFVRIIATSMEAMLSLVYWNVQYAKSSLIGKTNSGQ